MVGKIVMRVTGGAIALAATGAIVLLIAGFGPTLFGAEALIVTSGSMGDAAPIGSIAVTRLVDAASIDVGEIITFRYPQSRLSITHRVIEISSGDAGRVFITKGDANPSPDVAPVPISGSVHRVERVVTYAGRIVMFARTPAGLVGLIMIPIAGLLVDEARKRRKRSAEAVPAPALEAPSAPRGPDRETILLGAMAGLIVAQAVVRIGFRPRARRSGKRQSFAG